MLIIFIFTTGLTLGKSVDNETSLNSSTANASSTESLAAPAAQQDNTSTNSSAQSLKYIWSITGIEKDPIIMALDQDGSDLSGKAKYEPDSGDVWNGIVDGSLSGDQVKLTITAQKGNSLELIKLNGVYADDGLSGKFTAKDSDGKTTASGDFNAVWISPDISSFTPAKVAEAAVSQPQAATTITAPVQTSNTTSTTGETPEGLQTSSSQPSVKIGGKTKYVDVHEYAEKIGPGGDLSGVPPGMGG